MSANNSAANVSVMKDETLRDTCTGSTLSASFNTLITIVKMLHLKVLNQLRKKAKSTPLKILFIMSINDILVAGFKALQKTNTKQQWTNI